MKYLLTIWCLIAVTAVFVEAQSPEQKSKFKAWTVNVGKTKYKNADEEKKALRKFLRNSKANDDFNKKAESENLYYKRGSWRYSYLSEEEKIKYLCGSKDLPAELLLSKKDNSEKVPETKMTYLNWVEQGRVLPVRNQGICGSCWSFAATGIAEGVFMKRYTNYDTILSKQQMVDCDLQSFGCAGGYIYAGLEYIKLNKIATHDSYPYKGEKGLCNTEAEKLPATLNSVDFALLNGDEKMLKNYVAHYGPVGISMHTAGGFLDYQSGIYKNKSCIKTTTNHAMLLVGFGTAEIKGKKKDYWLVKNSWGTTWGEEGYVRIRRNLNNMCGIANVVYFAT